MRSTIRSTLIKGSIITSIGLVFLIVSALLLHRQEKIQSNYIKTEAKIVSSQAERGSKATVFFTITYTYQVNGQNYTSNRFDINSTAAEGPPNQPIEKLQALCDAAYPVGKIVDAWYNPENPSQAVLSIKLDDYGSRAVGIVTLIPGLLFLIQYLRKRKSQARNSA